MSDDGEKLPDLQFALKGSGNWGQAILGALRETPEFFGPFLVTGLVFLGFAYLMRPADVLWLVPFFVGVVLLFLVASVVYRVLPPRHCSRLQTHRDVLLRMHGVESGASSEELKNSLSTTLGVKKAAFKRFLDDYLNCTAR